MDKIEFELFEDLMRRLVAAEKTADDETSITISLQSQLQEANELNESLIHQRDLLERDLNEALLFIRSKGPSPIVNPKPLTWAEINETSMFKELLHATGFSDNEQDYALSKVNLARHIRALLQIPLKDARKLVESLPSIQSLNRQYKDQARVDNHMYNTPT